MTQNLKLACWALRDLDDKAYLAERVIGEAASDHVHEASANCDLAWIAAGENDAVTTLEHLLVMTMHVGATTDAMAAR